MAGPRDLRHGGRCHGKTWINVLFGLLQLLLPCIRQGEAQLQALAQMASVVEVWEAEEAELLLPSQGEEDQSTEGLPQEGSSLFDTRESMSPLSFQPPALAYGAQPLGLPRAETVHVHNPSQELPVTVLSMFTPSRHFHTPSFHRRVIPPRGKASFKLIFFPTEEGSVESTLFINTTLHGVLSYQVSGVGVHHGSSNVAQNRDGTLVFPHIQSIKLTQTQGDASNVTILGLLMESTLPKNYVGHPQGSCFQAEQKLVAQISLSERGEKHTDLEKLKPYVIENILVLFVVPPAANSLRVPKINIYMLNSGVKKLFVKEIQLFSKVDSTAEFKQVLLRASSTNFTQVASLVCKGPFPAHGKKCFRQISLQLLRNHTVKSHPAFGIHSRDLRDGSPVQFHISQTGEDHADVWLTSPLDFSFEVRNVTMMPEMDGLLEVVNFSGPLTVQPGCWRLLSLQLAGRTLPVSVVTAVTLDTSLGVSLELPLHFHFHSSLTKQGDVVFEASGECGRPCRLRLSESGRAQWQRSFLDSASSWQTDSILASELCARWRSHKKRLTCSWPRLPVETSSPLDFGASPVNESKVKFFTLKNPSSHPVSVELRPLASYSAPLGALDLLTKWFNISPLSVNVTATEFTLLKGSGQEEWRTADGALRLLLQPLESREVGVSFTPAEHKSVTSLILIRNNLTVFDVVMVRGQGARELLRIGGKLPGPGASLRFNVPQSTLMECRDGLRSNKPLFAIRKSFKVENAGELPLTVESMNINGYKCQGFGFEILQCRSFQLDYNSSSEINIVFTPDFTSSWVIRDMTLVTARGSTFPFTLNVTLPHHMLPLCAQVVPGPSWEETFWLVTIIFTCLSLGGVCLMAFHRAQYILNEFSSPGPRSNHHNSVLSRENGVVNAVSPPTANKIKGSCKTFVDSCNTSDKGKGKGSLAVANTPVRSQASSKKGSGALSQPQRKHKASLYYGRYKVSSPASAATALVPSTEEEEERGPECGFQQDPETCCSLSNGADEAGAALPPAAEEKPACLEESRNHDANEEKEPTRVMFPMETHSGFAESVTAPPSPRPGPLACSPAERPPAPSEPTPERKEPRRRDVVEVEPREESHMLEVPQPEKAELVAMANGSCKGKKNTGKNRRKPSDAVAGIPEPIVVVLSEKSRDLEWRDNRTAGRARNHCANGKLDTLKSGPGSESLVKQLQNGARMTRSRRKGPQRRPQWESGSDSASSSGSVRASRGSWGSWSSTSSVEGERDTIGKHHCNAAAPPTRKRDNMQHMYYPERDCHQALNSGYKTTSMQSLHRRDPCQSPEPAPTPSFSPSFAAVAAAGVDRNADTACPYLRDEKWAAPSVPLTNEFRYNTTESLSVVPQASTSGSYSCFPWGFADNPCANPYPYCEQNSYMPGNAHLQNSFTCPESKSMAYNDHPSWTEDSGQDMPATWISPNCMASKPYFSGTRSLSPMSGLFGSIWTPQSEPYQSTFQPERSLPPSPESPFVREPVGSSRPKPFSNFNPFGPHMNLDIWNSSSNRSSNSQLSNDSGYCGDT